MSMFGEDTFAREDVPTGAHSRSLSKMLLNFLSESWGDLLTGWSLVP